MILMAFCLAGLFGSCTNAAEDLSDENLMKLHVATRDLLEDIRNDKERDRGIDLMMNYRMLYEANHELSNNIVRNCLDAGDVTVYPIYEAMKGTKHIHAILNFVGVQDMMMYATLIYNRYLSIGSMRVESEILDDNTIRHRNKMYRVEMVSRLDEEGYENVEVRDWTPRKGTVRE